MIYIFIEVHAGLITDVRTCYTENTRDEWEQEWLQYQGYASIDLYRLAAEEGHPKDTYHIFETDLEL